MTLPKQGNGERQKGQIRQFLQPAPRMDPPPGGGGGAMLYVISPIAQQSHTFNIGVTDGQKAECYLPWKILYTSLTTVDSTR